MTSTLGIRAVRADLTRISDARSWQVEDKIGGVAVDSCPPLSIQAVTSQLLCVTSAVVAFVSRSAVFESS
jgi:hypothetical protein